MKLVFVRFLNNLLRHFDKEHVFLNFLFLPFFAIEVVCRDRCGRNTQMFNKKFITINNQ